MMQARMVLDLGDYGEVELELIDNDGLLIISDEFEDIQIQVDREKHQVTLETSVADEDGSYYQAILVLHDYSD